MSNKTPELKQEMLDLSEESFVRELARDGNSLVKRFVTKYLPYVIQRNSGIDLDALTTKVEEAQAVIKKLKSDDTSKPVKQLILAVYALFACGFTALTQIAELLTKEATPALIDKALSYMSVWRMIYDLYGAGMQHKLSESRLIFRTSFFQTGDSALKAKQCARVVFHTIVGQPVLDRTYQEFAVGLKAKEDVIDPTTHKIVTPKGAWIVKPRLVIYQETLKNSKNGGSGNPDLYRAQMTVAKVIEFNDAEKARITAEFEAKTQAA